MAPRIVRRTSRTQPLKIDTVIDEDEVHVPTKRRVALPERMLAENLTVAEAKSLLDADADRLEPKADGRKRKPVPGYGDEERAAAYRRVSKAARVAPEKLEDEQIRSGGRLEGRKAAMGPDSQAAVAGAQKVPGGGHSSLKGPVRTTTPFIDT